MRKPVLASLSPIVFLGPSYNLFLNKLSELDGILAAPCLEAPSERLHLDRGVDLIFHLVEQDLVSPQKEICGHMVPQVNSIGKVALMHRCLIAKTEPQSIKRIIKQAKNPFFLIVVNHGILSLKEIIK